MLKKILAGVTISGVLALAPGVAAQAMTWPSDDQFVIGNGQWEISEYGILYGWDAADVYNDNGFANYPTEGYSDDYLYCGADTSSSYQDSIVTEEANGDISIVCPVWEDDPWDYGYSGLNMQSFVRLYHEEKGGYLARFMTTFTNTTSSDIDLVEFVLAESTTMPDSFSSGDYLTSSSGSSLASGDTWSIAGNTDGSTIYQNSAWAKTGSGTGFTLVGQNMVYPTGSNTVPANGSVTLAFFTFIAIPASQDSAGATAAFAVSSSQTSEFDTFDGRLTCGIPEGTVVAFWGTAPADTACGSSALPDTGLSTNQVMSLLAASTGLVVAGLVALVMVRRRRTA